jgi:hypothetical protein
VAGVSRSAEGAGTIGSRKGWWGCGECGTGACERFVVSVSANGISEREMKEFGDGASVWWGKMRGVVLSSPTPPGH